MPHRTGTAQSSSHNAEGWHRTGLDRPGTALESPTTTTTRPNGGSWTRWIRIKASVFSISSHLIPSHPLPSSPAYIHPVLSHPHLPTYTPSSPLPPPYTQTYFRLLAASLNSHSHIIPPPPLHLVPSFAPPPPPSTPSLPPPLPKPHPHKQQQHNVVCGITRLQALPIRQAVRSPAGPQSAMGPETEQS